MARTDHVTVVNRVVLAALGVALIICGGLVLAAYLNQLSWVNTNARLVPGTAAPPTWVFLVVIAAAILLAALCLRWLAAQVFRAHTSTSWRVEAEGAAGRSTLASRTAAKPVATDIEEFHGVRSASSWLAGPRTAPELQLIVTVDPYTDVTALRRYIVDYALTALTRALEVEAVTVSLELRFTNANKSARLH